MNNGSGILNGSDVSHKSVVVWYVKMMSHVQLVHKPNHGEVLEGFWP